MQRKLILTILFIFCSSLLAFPPAAEAAFGISPPYVKSKQPLFPGSHFEQTITLLRSAQDDDLQARVVIDAPEIASWISIREGELFDLPKGKTQVPMQVLVDVPKDAEIGDYKGFMNVQIVPKGLEGGGVSIALGARIDIELSVTNETFFDFTVRRIDIPDFEVFAKPWKWPPFAWFFYRIKVAMTIENIGNVPVAPTKVELDIYDISEKNRLETLVDKKMEKIPAFTTGEVVADFPTKLSAGQYWGQVKVFKDNEIIHKNKLIFTVSPAGGMENPPPLSKWAYVLLGGMILLFVLILLLLVKIKIWRHLGKALLLILWPLFFLLKLIGRLFSMLNRSFWRWIHEKSKKYQDGPGSRKK